MKSLDDIINSCQDTSPDPVPATPSIQVELPEKGNIGYIAISYPPLQHLGANGGSGSGLGGACGTGQWYGSQTTYGGGMPTAVGATDFADYWRRLAEPIIMSVPGTKKIVPDKLEGEQLVAYNAEVEHKTKTSRLYDPNTAKDHGYKRKSYKVGE